MREQIERALGPFLGEEISTGWEFALDVLGLSREAIVIECEVEHEIIGMITRIKQTNVKHYDRVLWSDMGYHGTPGKALAIIIPLGEE